MTIPPPNHTQTPNIFFDDSLPRIQSLAELKIILATIRQTFGWHKGSDRLSLSQFQKLTGLTRQGVLNGISRAMEDGFLEREGGKAGRGHAFTYKLAVADNSQLSRPEKVNAVDQLGLVNSQRSRLTKERVKEKKEMSDYALLFDKHYKRLGGDVPDAQAQGKAIKEILKHHPVEKALACYESQLTESWRKGHITWLTVRQRISEFQFNGNSNTYFDSGVTMEQLREMVK